MLRSWSPVKNWWAVRAWSRHPPAACRRHPARGVRGQEGNGAGNVVRLGHALQRLHAEGEIPAGLAWIEGGLLRETLHEVVDAADPRRVLLPVVDLVERELILDRRLLLDNSWAEFRLLPAAGVLRILVVRVLAIGPSGADGGGGSGSELQSSGLPAFGRAGIGGATIRS